MISYINYIEPDIFVVCDPAKLDEKGCHGTPDWVIEIFSEGSRKMDYMTQLFQYRSADVREYWIVDPKKQRTIVYNFEHDSMEEYSFEDEVSTGIFEELLIQLKKGSCFN